jgi:transposase
MRAGRLARVINDEQLVEATDTSLMDLHGIGPSGAARLLAEVADIRRHRGS